VAAGGGVKRIPLRNRKKEIVAYALVDDEDFDALNAHRWHRSGYGYANRSVWVPETGKIKHLAMHRVLLGLDHGDPREGDHENRDRLDNRRSNLRILLPGQNPQNMSGHTRTAAKGSQHRGVCWHKAKKKWMAYSRADGKIKFLGYFDDELVAARAARDFRLEHMPYAVEDAA
jgi:hypothetical protein